MAAPRAIRGGLAALRTRHAASKVLKTDAATGVGSNLTSRITPSATSVPSAYSSTSSFTPDSST